MKRLLLALALVIAAPAAAQDPAQRADDLETLSHTFGGLHHIRRMCEPRDEAEIWRSRMRRLVELEQPQPAVRDRMVAAFNAAFRAAEARFPSCDREARDYAAALAAEGDAAVARLSAPLYSAFQEP